MAAAKDRIEIYESRKVRGQYGWRYKTKNGKKIAISGELYEKESHAEKMARYLFGRSIDEQSVDLIFIHPKRTKR